MTKAIKENIQGKLNVYIANNFLIINDESKENRYEIEKIKKILITEEKTNWYPTIFLNLLGFLLFNSVNKSYKEKRLLEIEIFVNNSLNFNRESYDLYRLKKADLKNLRSIVSEISSR